MDAGRNRNGRKDGIRAKTDIVWLELGIGTYMQCDVHELTRMLGAVPVAGLLSWS